MWRAGPCPYVRTFFFIELTTTCTLLCAWVCVCVGKWKIIPHNDLHWEHENTVKYIIWFFPYYNDDDDDDTKHWKASLGIFGENEIWGNGTNWCVCGCGGGVVWRRTNRWVWSQSSVLGLVVIVIVTGDHDDDDDDDPLCVHHTLNPLEMCSHLLSSPPTALMPCHRIDGLGDTTKAPPTPHR